MRYAIASIFLILLLGLFTPVNAQQYIFKNYTVNDGLISNAVRRVFQDSKGFLWIATWEGISKYDGNSFTNYNTSNGLSHNLANDFYESPDGQLYAALNNGVIDIIKDTRIVPAAATFATVVNRFIYSPEGKISVTTDRNGIQKFVNGRLESIKQDFPFASFADLAYINDTTIIAIGDSSIRILNNNYELIAEAKDPFAEHAESTILVDSKKRIWIGTSSGLKLLTVIPAKNQPLLFDQLPALFAIPALQHNKINDIFEDDAGTMWFGTTAGLVRIGLDNTQQVITKKDGFSSGIVTSVFQDKEKNIWFATDAGLSKLVTRSVVRLYPIENGLLSSDNQYLFYPFNKNYFLVCTSKGLKIFDKIKGQFSSPAQTINDHFYSFISKKNPVLLIGGTKMLNFDTTSSQFSSAQDTTHATTARLIVDKSGNTFAGNFDRLVFSDQKNEVTILNYRISSLLLDKNGTLWAGTWMNGLFRIIYTTTNGSFQLQKMQHFLATENVRSISQDSKGDIWVGTRYNGVYHLNSPSNFDVRITNFSQANGLTSNFIKGIREDNKGNIWVAFYQGLDKLVRTSNDFSVFNFSRINNYFANVVGIETDQDRLLWLVTSEGIVNISDGEMEKSPPLSVHITRVFSNDSIYDIAGNGIKMNYRQRQLQVEFSASGFINEKQILYSYRLTGDANTRWSTANNQHVVSFASLHPGSYLFEVRSLGWNGEWGSPASFRFVITPPFWQQWWFISICGLLLAALTFLLMRRRIKLVRQKADMKHNLAKTEMMALRAQMNPHFIFNSLSAIDNLIQTNQPDKATLYLSRFAKLIRGVLDSSKNNVISFQKDLETMRLYLEMEQFRSSNKFSFTITADPDLLNSDYKVPPLIIQPFLENAIQHGLLNKQSDNRQLTITIQLLDEYVQYTIIDNGIGRQLAETIRKMNRPEHTSYGIQITNDRITLHNGVKSGDILISDLMEKGIPSGTKVVIKIRLTENRK